tara:strand:+ start:13 stop:327 length:315 start_codon:yes stop_codon:yes gene_type:complete
MKLKLTESPGKQTYFKVDGDDMHVVTEQKIDHILDHNKRQANDWRYGNLIGNTQRHQQKVAELPANLYYELVAKLGDPKHNLKAWKRWLNDPENRHFRSIGGTV